MEQISPEINLFQLQNAFILFIIGITASGKSKLALDLAQKFNGVIINADSMQIYENYGIMTAKPTEEEMELVPHMLYGHVNVDTKNYNVTEWYNNVVPTIWKVIEDGKLPIIWGGTAYYVKQLLLDTDIDEFESQPLTLEEIEQKINEIEDETMSKDVFSLHSHLKETYWMEKEPRPVNYTEEDIFPFSVSHPLMSIIDPKLSSFIPLNNSRKMFNCLRKFYQKRGSFKESDLRLAQHPKLRFPSAIIHLTAERENIEERVRKRVGKMLFEVQSTDTIKQGSYSSGITEICDVFTHFYSQNQDLDSLDFGRGILQSIGYKEFLPFFRETVSNHTQFLELAENIKTEGEPAVEKVRKYLEEHKELENLIQTWQESLCVKTMQYTTYQK